MTVEPGRLRIAYLCNSYPAISHSFVRREIEGLVALGHDVARFSIRPYRPDLKDPADLREAAVTEAVLGGNLVSVLLIALFELIAHPVRAARAIGAAFRMSAGHPRMLVRQFAYLLEAAWLVRRFRQLGIAHLHAHFGTNPAAVALLAKALGGPPFSFTVHGPDEFDSPIGYALGQKIAAASFVVAISSFGRSQLMRWSATEDWSKIRVIRCGVDDDFLDRAAVAVPGSTEFCCIARLAPQKGLPLLIDACERLHKQGEDFSLTIIGDGDLRPGLEAAIAAKGLDQRVFLVGSKSAEDIRIALLRSRAFVLPSFAEGLPVVLMEALAMGRPVITSSIAGIPELVDKDCGWLIPAGSVDAIVEAMRAALHAGPEELAAKGQAGAARVRHRHSASRGAELIAQAITANLPRLR